MDINQVLDELGIDKARIQRTFSGNTKLFERFLKKFIDDKTYSSLCAAVENGDVHEIEVAAHTLKGITGNLGLDKIFNFSTDIMQSAKDGDMAKIEALMVETKEEYNRIIPYIQKIM